MIAPRIMAIVFVLVLITCLSLAVIGVVAQGGPLLAHGGNVEHADGKIISIGPGLDFVLKTSSGKEMHFLCESSCRASLGHLQRHLNEHAHTDVYYIEGLDHSLMVMDVD